MKYLDLGPGNHFSGSLRLDNPIDFFVIDNWITDIIVQNTSSLTVCNLSNNPLLGNPNINALTMCTKTGLYSAGFLPNTITTIVSVVKKTATTQLCPTISKSAASLFLSILAVKFPVSTTKETIIKTYVFRPLERNFQLWDLVSIIGRLFVSFGLLLFTSYKTPWKRELRNKIKRRNETASQKDNSLLWQQ